MQSLDYKEVEGKMNEIGSCIEKYGIWEALKKISKYYGIQYIDEFVKMFNHMNIRYNMKSYSYFTKIGGLECVLNASWGKICLLSLEEIAKKQLILQKGFAKKRGVFEHWIEKFKNNRSYSSVQEPAKEMERLILNMFP